MSIANQWMPVEQRFWRQVSRAGSSDCWHWLGDRLPTGYGIMRVSGRRWYAHRVSWWLHNGQPEMRPTLIVMHRCDNPPCVNPAHLWRGTQAENIADMDRKGRRRSNGRRGETNGRAKLSTAVVLDLKRSTESPRVLAARFGVSESLVRQIIRGIVWKHVGAAT